MSSGERIGIIGGSGLYAMAALEGSEECLVETPFGPTSGVIRVGRIGEQAVAFLARHGEGHRVDPTRIPYRANIWALKRLGVTRILSVSAVGSMRESIRPGDLVLVDQFIDRTRHRRDSFFGDGLVAHVGFADPICATLHTHLTSASRGLDLSVHVGGTYVCMEGPQFSTRAESRLYRSFDVDVIGMTNLTEARLAREAELCYATIAMATDYDCWYDSAEDVTVEAVLATMKKNVANAARLLVETVRRVSANEDCRCRHALDGAIMTAPEHVDPETRARVDLLVGPYLTRGNKS